MKYPAHIYAKALAEVIVSSKEPDDARIAKNFIAIVERNGDEMHLRKILEEAARFVRGKKGIRKVTFESTRPPSKSQRDEMKAFVRAGDVIEERIDASLIAGLRIIVDDERQFDGSMKGKLDNMFA